MAAIVFAGDRRVWRVAVVAAVPLIALVAFYCVRPRDYYTGTNSVEAFSYVAEAHPGEALCVPGLHIPSGTARIQLQLISRTRVRPALTLALKLEGPPARTIDSVLAPVTVVRSDRISGAVFTIPPLAARPSERLASLCLTASDLVNWGGTTLAPGSPLSTPTLGGRPLPARIAVWYLPPAGAQRSYLSHVATILRRAALFRPGFVGSWLYVLIFLLALPALGVASVRCLALAAAPPPSSPPEERPGALPRGARSGRGYPGARRMAAWLFAIAALNFACWALITPAFQAPDEVDHFAYTQSLVERGEAPSPDPRSPLPRWSSTEGLALDAMSFGTDHQVGDTRPPWTARQQAEYRTREAASHPSPSDGGGNETAATHGPIYYAALAPAYVLASSSPFAQLTLMRLTSALIGALVVVFAFLLARELSPARPWLAVLAGLLVAYEPMYGFISGTVNNDVGINAATAALELLLILILRRGFVLRLAVLAGGLLLTLPFIKGTAYSLYPVAVVALLAALVRHHRRRDLVGLAGFAVAGLVMREASVRFSDAFGASASPSASAFSAPADTGSVVAGATSETLAHPLGYLGYLWQVFLPRLSFMAPHFETTNFPAFVIFVERGWGAFGWYDVLFPHWVYVTLLIAMLTVPVLGIVAARREWTWVRRNALELAILVLMPLAVVAGFEAAFYTTGTRPRIAEFGRYAFPAIAPLAVLVVASLHAFGRRSMIVAGTGLLVAMLALSYAAQLLTLTGFYA